eukprot:CAMPEP_0170603310 /NCGR_PEP_ID=MMETSP0224-20130122/18845_1 /TAXON_ID=285029 /ORGANISM="Togula jolla, Strain CCCM 725" /LENGTH=109 /DNA_ID=CAMNT_0010928185 /DNA_START=1061 /DNA_END=1391 /DNA_ORIENTATION=-
MDSPPLASTEGLRQASNKWRGFGPQVAQDWAPSRDAEDHKRSLRASSSSVSCARKAATITAKARRRCAAVSDWGAERQNAKEYKEQAGEVSECCQEVAKWGHPLQRDLS